MKKLLFTCICFAIVLTGYSQNDKTAIEAGAITLESNIPPNPKAGTICWTGTEFLGFNGVQWILLNENESEASKVPIKIWSYLFQFPITFSLVPENDADFSAGTIEGAGLSLDFEHSLDDVLAYLTFDEGISESGDIYINNEIDGHNISIIQPSDLNEFTKITIVKLGDNTDSDSQLVISVNNITRAQQEMLVDIFKAVEIVEPSVPIKIGRYQFQFPLEFSLVPGQGLDSYVGNIYDESGISLNFDYGPYTGPKSNLPATEYVVTEDEIEGNFRQIVKPFDSQNNITRIHMYSYNAALEDPYFHSKLTLSVKNITTAEQEMIINVFNNVEILY